MCLAIYGVDSKHRIRLDFAHERLYLKRNGGVVIWLDLLVRNLGEEPIGRLRVVLPDRLVEISKLQKKRVSAKKANRLVNHLRSSEPSLFTVRTDQFNHTHDVSHWPYRKMQHVRIDSALTKDGVFSIRRSGQKSEESPTLEGFIKHGWRVEQPEAIKGEDTSTWLTCVTNEVTFLDLVSGGDERERLLKGEAMWLRLKFSLPARGYNRKKHMERLIPRSREFEYVFRSPGQVLTHVRNQLECNDVTSWDPGLQTVLASAKRGALGLLPSHSDLVEVKDWRVLVYREYGLRLKRITQQANQAPVCPDTRPEFDLPPDADPPGCLRWPLPLWLHFLYGQSERHVTVEQFFIGTSFRRQKHPDSCVTRISTETGNTVYVYLVWLSFILSILSIILTIILSR